MTDDATYRNDLKLAVKTFRPVLQAIKVRSTNTQPAVYMVSFDHLAELNIDEYSIQFVTCNIDSSGMFLIKYTKTGLLRAYIILNTSLYSIHTNNLKQIRKIAGVHEFIHFIAIVYVATVTGTASLRSTLLNRLRHTVDKLPGPNLLALYNALSGQSKEGGELKELTDSHFRLGYEGNTPDYEDLFLHFMFSRELFETYFDDTNQNRFKDLLLTGKTEDAIQLLVNMLQVAASDKDIPLSTAKNQLLEWVHVYMRP